MPAQRYVKRPVVVFALEFTGDNFDEVGEFTHHQFRAAEPLEFPDDLEIVAAVWDELHDSWVGVHAGDRLVCGLAGEFYPVAQDQFARLYVAAED